MRRMVSAAARPFTVVKIFSLVGVGGSGKTRIAAEPARLVLFANPAVRFRRGVTRTDMTSTPSSGWRALMCSACSPGHGHLRRARGSLPHADRGAARLVRTWSGWPPAAPACSAPEHITSWRCRR